MITRGEGGIGKSIAVHTVSEYFRHRGTAHLLLRTAYTGVESPPLSLMEIHVILLP
jgi:hypothetical protein